MPTGTQIGTLQRATSAFELATKSFNVGVAALYREDGSRTYSESVHSKRLEDLQTTLRQAGQALNRDIDQLIADVDASAASIDPLLELRSEAARSEATYKMAIIRETVEQSSMADLATDMHAIAANGSDIDRLLYLRFAQRRLAKERQTGQGSDGVVQFALAVKALSPDPDGSEARAVEAFIASAQQTRIAANGRLYDLIGDQSLNRQTSLRF